MAHSSDLQASGGNKRRAVHLKHMCEPPMANAPHVSIAVTPGMVQLSRPSAEGARSVCASAFEPAGHFQIWAQK